MMKWLLTVGTILALWTAPLRGDPRQLDVFTSFEPPSNGPVFGGDPISATFTGGSARVVGIGSLYHSGSFSWEVPAGVTTVVEFNGPASTVEFFALDTGAVNTSVVAFDTSSQQVGQIALTSTFSSPMGDFSNPLRFAGAISRLEFRNPGSGSAWIDDFGFSALPAPQPTGDYNGNGVVDAADYTLWRDTLGQDVTPGIGADGNANGRIDEGDYDFWKSKFGNTIPGASAAAVPEPATAWLLAMSIMTIGLGRRHRPR